jgi:hypothetical protein
VTIGEENGGKIGLSPPRFGHFCVMLPEGRGEVFEIKIVGKIWIESVSESQVEKSFDGLERDASGGMEGGFEQIKKEKLVGGPVAGQGSFGKKVAEVENDGGTLVEEVFVLGQKTIFRGTFFQRILGLLSVGARGVEISTEVLRPEEDCLVAVNPRRKSRRRVPRSRPGGVVHHEARSKNFRQEKKGRHSQNSPNAPPDQLPTDTFNATHLPWLSSSPPHTEPTGKNSSNGEKSPLRQLTQVSTHQLQTIDLFKHPDTVASPMFSSPTQEGQAKVPLIKKRLFQWKVCLPNDSQQYWHQ